METLVVVEQHRNPGYSRSNAHFTGRFGSSSSRAFVGINCRTFEYGDGSFPVSPQAFPSYACKPRPKSSVSRSDPSKLSRRSNPISICPKSSLKHSTFCEDLSLSELWAGPTYSHSPPPSSLPLPKFSLCQKRSISLDFADSRPDISFQHNAKSAMASPAEDAGSPSTTFLPNAASATENLRRILNLEP